MPRPRQTQGKPRSNQIECQKSKPKTGKQKPKPKAEERRTKVAGQNKRRPDKTFRHKRDSRKANFRERPAYLANTPEPGIGGRRYSFPYPTETSHSQVVAALRFSGRIKRMLMSSMKDCPPSPQPHSLAIRRWNGGIEGAAWEQDVGEARREVKHEKGSRNESLEA